MATTDKESSAAGTDNRPPMLEESDFESWKIRIERYIRGKPLGKLIWKSIKNGPSPHPMITVTTGEGEQQTQVTREKTDEEFTEAENNKERADIQATNILSQGLPRHIFNTLNQTEMAKEIWENVELLMQGKYAPAPQQVPQSTNDAMLATMNQIVNLLSGFQKQFPPTNNQLRTSTNPKTQATIQAGQITTESVQRRAPGNKGKHAATGSQGKVVTCYNCRGQGHVARECKEKK
ncbi:cytochrome P450 76AD1-like protein [Tanacetum coccineum]|uniref:Cytochrome P450 76AD1-like protein n=1 Tax=Tanacetum coccineum TaxID=301880 RepID=A0ABQ4Z203_9ASTR